MVSKLERSELEDKYVRLYEQYLLIKMHAQKQEDKIRRYFCAFKCVCLNGDWSVLQESTVIQAFLNHLMEVIREIGLQLG